MQTEYTVSFSQTKILVFHTEILSLIVCCIILRCFPSLLLYSLTSPLFRYTQNGILHMLDRNKRIKSKPERFQNCKDKFDLVITCEERVYDQVLEGEASHNKYLITEGSIIQSPLQEHCFDTTFYPTMILLQTLLILWHTLSSVVAPQI